MSENVHKNSDYGLPVQIASLSVALLLYTTSMTSPALGEIIKAFPNVAPETIKMITTIPSLCMVVFSFVSGQLTRRFAIKRVILVASGILFVGGIFPTFLNNIELILASRVLFGAGYGLVFPLASAVVTDLFDGEKRDKLMGFKSGIGAAAGIVFQLLGGVLAAYDWHYSFLGFLLVIPIFILVIVQLPETEVAKKETASGNGEKEKISKGTWLLTLIGFLVNIMQFSFMIDVAVVMQTDKIGNSAQAGFVLTAFTVASFFVGMFYGKIAKVFRKFVIAGAVLILGISFIILLFAPSYAVFLIAALVFGAGFGMLNPAFALAVAASAPERKFAPLALSIYTCGVGLGQFISPYALEVLRNICHLTVVRADWLLAAITLLVGSIIGLIVTSAKKANA